MKENTKAASETGQLKTGTHLRDWAATPPWKKCSATRASRSRTCCSTEIIEQRTTEILEQYAATQPDCTPHPPGTSAIGVVMPPANRIVVAPPAYDDMDEDDEEEDDEQAAARAARSCARRSGPRGEEKQRLRRAEQAS